MVKFLCNLSDSQIKELQTEGYISQVRNLSQHLGKRATLVSDSQALKPNDLVHIHDSGFYSAFKYRKLPNKKIFTVHSALEPKYFATLRDVLQMPRIMKLTDRTYGSIPTQLIKRFILVLSAFIPLRLKAYWLKKMDVVILPTQDNYRRLNIPNAKVIRQAIDIDKFRRIKESHKGIRVAYFGHLAISKGVLEVVTAFSRIPYERRMYITTPTPTFTKIVRKKDPGIALKGFVKDILREYNAVDIIVAPYRHSGGAIATPLVILEAMACERAVITSDLPHLREICGDAAIYIKPGSVNQLVDAINRLANDAGLRKNLGEKGRRRITELYDQKDMFKSYEHLYSSIQ